MQILWKWSAVIIHLLYYVGDKWKGFSITGSANPPIAQIGQKVTLSCEMKGCTSSKLRMHLYKWESHKNQTLFIHDSTREPSIQENSPEEREKNGSPRGQYKDGLLSVTLNEVQLANNGQYVCAVTCDDVYKESTMQLQVEGKIKVGIGEVAVFTFQTFQTCSLSHLKLLWRRTDSGKSQKIYSYLHQEACPIIYSEDSLGDRCSSSHGPISREWFGEKYQQRAEISKSQMLMRNVTSFKVSDIQREDAGKYLFSVESQEFRQVVVFTLSVTGSRSSDIFSWVLLFFIIFVLDFLEEIYNFKRKDSLRAENRFRGFGGTNGSSKDSHLPGSDPQPLHAHKTEQSNCLSLKSTDPLKAENDQLRKENEQAEAAKDHLRTENDQLKTENEKMHSEKEKLKVAKEFSDARFNKVDVIFDSKTAHPRLEVFEAGKSVRDTGNISKFSKSEDIPHHMGILATQGYSKGSYYWEVDISQKKKWELGVASESISRKGDIKLSPQNDYWVIGTDGGKDYWARTDPWTLLTVTGRPARIGIFLDMSADKRLSFYDVHREKKLYTYTINCSAKLYPFFSLGVMSVKEYNQPVNIVKFFEKEEILQ
ncbi:uncharacterized protein LOC103065767 isoform X3 [Python bivittatus]|uniref:Uncharacterized protein LOC103065767 isoform X3 n=1 Tax=Python bivittatus TaxID=176946 RepID=A0A9F5J7K0_PYTBI|nr:uncharacterized protein LOC103065767 isoform X3 [Python bivittatus]